MESRNENMTAATDNFIVGFSLPSLINEMKQEEGLQKTGRVSRTLHKWKNMRMVLMVMLAGNEIKPHQANGPISVHCLEGEMKFFAEDKVVTLRAGEMLSLKEFVRHSVEAVEHTAFLLTVAPLEAA